MIDPELGRRVSLACLLATAGCDEEPPARSKRTEEAPVATSTEAKPAPSAQPTSPTPSYERESLPHASQRADDLAEQRRTMVERMKAMGVATDAQAEAIEAILSGSEHLGQGNPEAIEHPMSRRECLERRRAAQIRERRHERCGAPFMAPVYDPATEAASDAEICIDRYEFPGLPCDYPVTWVTTAEARALCGALGKRLCDAHEWEGACAGKLLAPKEDYRFGSPRKTARALHNRDRTIVWAYGEEKDHAKCATGSRRSEGCAASGWKACGSNTYPTGAFPECRSPFGVYDLHGNAAEHMWLPLAAEDLGRRGGTGVPEMKGSWFIFESYEAHRDDCRWRAPAWHADEGTSHANYHLGFRCCRDVDGASPSP